MESESVHMKILIIGASGGIGSVIAKRFPDAICPPRTELDLLYPDGNPYFDYDFDVLIYCAGINQIGKYDVVTIQDHFQINALSFYALAYNPNLHHVIAISSLYARRVKKGRLCYSVSKAALEAIIRGLAVELAPTTLINGIAPGFVDTKLTRKNNTQEQINTIIDQTPLHKLIPADEIADLVEFLVYQNKSITGQILTIDGGYSL